MARRIPENQRARRRQDEVVNAANYFQLTAVAFWLTNGCVAFKVGAMKRLKAAFVCVALLATHAAQPATELVGFSDTGLSRDAGGSMSRSVGAGFDSSTWNLLGATEGDQPYTLDESALAARAGAAGEPGPFALTVLLIAFAGLTAFFAGKRSAGRGLISA